MSEHHVSISDMLSGYWVYSDSALFLSRVPRTDNVASRFKRRFD